MSSESQAQLNAVLAFCSAINASDVNSIAHLLSDESFSHKYLPSTMGPESQGTRDKAQTLAVFKGTFENVVEHMGVRMFKAASLPVVG